MINPALRFARRARPYRERPGWRFLLRDILRGALLGDFASQLGFAGALTQVVLNYVPIIGTLCAWRDMLADWRRRDRPGVLLNMIAMIPFVGGIAKMVEVSRDIRRIGRGILVSRRT